MIDVHLQLTPANIHVWVPCGPLWKRWTFFERPLWTDLLGPKKFWPHYRGWVPCGLPPWMLCGLSSWIQCCCPAGWVCMGPIWAPANTISWGLSLKWVTLSLLGVQKQRKSIGSKPMWVSNVPPDANPHMGSPHKVHVRHKPKCKPTWAAHIKPMSDTYGQTQC